MAYKSRRRAREAALKVLFELEFGDPRPDEALARHAEEVDLPPDQRNFAQRVIHGVRGHQPELDAALAALIPDYDFRRLAIVDRNVLRIAAYELTHEPAIPPAVTINEAVEIVRTFSTAESAKFVNGILGSYIKTTPKVNWDPSTAPDELEEPDWVPEEPEAEAEEEIVTEESDEGKQVLKFGVWTLKSATEPEILSDAIPEPESGTKVGEAGETPAAAEETMAEVVVTEPKTEATGVVRDQV